MDSNKSQDRSLVTKNCILFENYSDKSIGKSCVQLKNRSIKVKKKLPLSFEPAYQIMYISAIIICFCLAVIFATTIQQFNWYSVNFMFMGMILTYFKRATYVKLFEQTILCIYFKGLLKKRIPISEIKSLTISPSNRKVIFEMSNQTQQIIYLSRSNQKVLAKWLKNDVPKIELKEITVI